MWCHCETPDFGSDIMSFQCSSPDPKAYMTWKRQKTFREKRFYEIRGLKLRNYEGEFVGRSVVNLFFFLDTMRNYCPFTGLVMNQEV